MLLKDLLSAEHLVGEYSDADFSRISRNADDCRNAALFCLAGRTFCENDFISKAETNGASVIVSDFELRRCRIPCVLVKNARRAYSFACSAICGAPQTDMHIYGITGTNGKTSTSYFVHSLLDYCGIRNALIGTTGIIADGEAMPFPPPFTP